MCCQTGLFHIIKTISPKNNKHIYIKSSTLHSPHQNNFNFNSLYKLPKTPVVIRKSANMQFSAAFFSLLSVASAITVSVSYDTGYDDSTRSLAEVSCSDGSNGLITKGYKTQGSLPLFPLIGGAFVIAGWNSASCGTCWALTYNGVTINVLAMDHTGNGFNIGETAMNKLTNNQAVALGRVEASCSQIDASYCGL